ncbi:MAG: LysE family translocator [Phycicoccus sp.]
MLSALALGASLGLAAGLSPGPLMALTMSTTLRHGLRSGLAVAASPLISDGPLIAAVVLAVAALNPAAVTVLYLLGAGYVTYLALHQLRAAPEDPEPGTNPPPAATARVLLRGAVVNLLSPAPWLFWSTVGAPALVRAWRTDPAHAAAFLILFALTLVGSGAAVAITTALLGRALTPAGRHRLAITCALLLLASGAALLIHGIRTATDLLQR